MAMQEELVHFRTTAGGLGELYRHCLVCTHACMHLPVHPLACPRLPPPALRRQAMPSMKRRSCPDWACGGRGGGRRRRAAAGTQRRQDAWPPLWRMWVDWVEESLVA